MITWNCTLIRNLKISRIVHEVYLVLQLLSLSCKLPRIDFPVIPVEKVHPFPSSALSSILPFPVRLAGDFLEKLFLDFVVLLEVAVVHVEHDRILVFSWRSQYFECESDCSNVASRNQLVRLALPARIILILLLRVFDFFCSSRRILVWNSSSEGLDKASCSPWVEDVRTRLWQREQLRWERQTLCTDRWGTRVRTGSQYGSHIPTLPLGSRYQSAPSCAVWIGWCWKDLLTWRSRCRVERSTHKTSTIETRAILSQWRWAWDALSLSTLKDMLAVGERVPEFRDTSLGDHHGASALDCGVAVTCLRAHGVLYKSEGVVHELTVTAGVDHVTDHELLLAQRLQAAGGEGPGIFDVTCGRKPPIRATLSLVLHKRHPSLHTVVVSRGPKDFSMRDNPNLHQFL